MARFDKNKKYISMEKIDFFGTIHSNMAQYIQTKFSLYDISSTS